MMLRYATVQSGVRRYAEQAEPFAPGNDLPIGQHVNLQLQTPGRKSFFLQVDAPMQVGSMAAHG